MSVNLDADTVLDTVTSRVAGLLAPLVAPNTIDVEPAGDPDGFPALDLSINGWRPVEHGSNFTRYDITFTVGGYIERGDGIGGNRDRAALHAAAVAALMGEPPLGGLAEEITDGALRMHTAVLASSRRLAFAQDFTARVVTQRANPAQPA